VLKKLKGIAMSRPNNRAEDQLRDVNIELGWSEHAEGSALISFGSTKVLCTASFTPGVPRFKKDSGEGWVTAEYSMLPRATHDRSDRETEAIEKVSKEKLAGEPTRFPD
jgi:ribonuclease PH